MLEDHNPIPYEAVDAVTLYSLIAHYDIISTCPDPFMRDNKKLVKALKRVIEYYGGSVE